MPKKAETDVRTRASILNKGVLRVLLYLAAIAGFTYLFIFSQLVEFFCLKALFIAHLIIKNARAFRNTFVTIN